MRFRLYMTSGVIALATIVTSSMLALFTLNMAQAAVPPFDPAGNGATQGTITLYDGSGSVVTGGSLSSPPAYALANTDTGRNGDNKASLYAATPQEGVNALLWPSDIIAPAATYPDSGAPGALKNNSHALAANPFTWLDPDDADSYPTAFPNTNTTASWQNLYQLRIITSGPGQAADTQRFSSATIQVDSGAGTWTQVYPSGGAKPTVKTAATVTGTKKVGSTLTCKAAFTGATSTACKWFRGAKAIKGKTAKTYTAVTKDANKMLKCRATGKNAFGSVSTTSPAVKIKPAR